jgi:hypothetical protein
MYVFVTLAVHTFVRTHQLAVGQAHLSAQWRTGMFLRHSYAISWSGARERGRHFELSLLVAMYSSGQATCTIQRLSVAVAVIITIKRQTSTERFLTLSQRNIRLFCEYWWTKTAAFVENPKMCNLRTGNIICKWWAEGLREPIGPTGRCECWSPPVCRAYAH